MGKRIEALEERVRELEGRVSEESKARDIHTDIIVKSMARRLDRAEKALTAHETRDDGLERPEEAKPNTTRIPTALLSDYKALEMAARRIIEEATHQSGIPLTIYNISCPAIHKLDAELRCIPSP